MRGRASFRALARARRCRRGAVTVSCLRTSGDPTPPRVAFSVSRAVGPAVVRNKVRRRLRAALRENAELLEPGASYLVTAAAPARRNTYRELSAALSGALSDLRSEESR